MKGVIWSCAIFVFGMCITYGLVIYNKYHYYYDLLSNSNRRSIMELGDYILLNDYRINHLEAMTYYLESLDFESDEDIDVDMYGYNLNPLVVRIKLSKEIFPFLIVTSDETIIEEEVND